MATSRAKLHSVARCGDQLRSHAVADFRDVHRFSIVARVQAATFKTMSRMRMSAAKVLKLYARIVDVLGKEVRGNGSTTSFIAPRFGKKTMKNSLEVRRQKLLRELDRLNRQILSTQKSVSQLQNRIATLGQPSAK